MRVITQIQPILAAYKHSGPSYEIFGYDTDGDYADVVFKDNLFDGIKYRDRVLAYGEYNLVGTMKWYETSSQLSFERKPMGDDLHDQLATLCVKPPTVETAFNLYGDLKKRAPRLGKAMFQNRLIRRCEEFGVKTESIIEAIERENVG